MRIAKLLGGTSLLTVLVASGALGQQSLPTIEVGATRAKPMRQAGERLQNVGGGRAATTAPSTPSRATDPTIYNPPNATTALKTDTPIMETPVAIQVVPQQVIRDRQDVRLSDVLDNVSGVIKPPSTQGQTAECQFARGFQNCSYYRDGFRVRSDYVGAGPVNLANIDRVEVMKGPASILYGRAEPGGMVNLITKQPVATPLLSVQQQVDSYGFKRSSLDMGGRITNDDTLLYRLNLSYEDTNTFRQFGDRRDFFIAPVVRWNIDAATNFTAWFDYKRSNDPYDNGSIAYIDPNRKDNRPLSYLPRGRNFAEPWQRDHQEDMNIGFKWSHAFNDNWTVRHQFNFQEGNLNDFWGYGLGFFDPANPTLLSRDGYWIHNRSDIFTTSADLTGKFNTFGLEHTLLAGGDYQSFASYGISYLLTQPIRDIDINFPIHDSFRGLPPLDPTSYFRSDFVERWYGVYVQDQIKLPYNVFLLAGGRYDNAKTDFWLANDPVKTVDKAQRVTPRFGLLWRPIPELSVYGSYLQNFGGANYSFKNIIPPETAEQWEVGAKTELFDGRLTATLAFYDLMKKNIAVPDPVDPTQSKAVGAARSRGIELDVAGEILPGLKIIGAYSYIAAYVVKDQGQDWNNVDADGNPGITAGYTGNRLPNIPRHSGSIWTTYEIKDGDWKGLKFGGGAVARSIRQGSVANDFQLPGYATIGLMTGYQTKLMDRKVNFQLNVDNLLDTRYYPTSGTPLSVSVGAPRTFKGSVRVEF